MRDWGTEKLNDLHIVTYFLSPAIDLGHHHWSVSLKIIYLVSGRFKNGAQAFWLPVQGTFFCANQNSMVFPQLTKLTKWHYNSTITTGVKANSSVSLSLLFKNTNSSTSTAYLWEWAAQNWVLHYGVAYLSKECFGVGRRYFCTSIQFSSHVRSHPPRVLYCLCVPLWVT